MKRVSLALTILLGLATALLVHNRSEIFNKPGGLVPDQRTAIAIAEAVLFPIYGEKNIRQQRPYVAKHARGKWIIEGAGYAGGVFHIEIGQRDAKILELWHEV
jgi:hypothetical protein